jgi:hypothetical protein
LIYSKALVRPRACLAAVAVAGLLVAGDGALEATPAAASTAPACVSSHILISHGKSLGAAGTTFVPIVFTNRGAACTIWGVPTINPVTSASPHQKVGPASRNTSMGEMAALHTLQRGQSVSTAFGVADTGNYVATSCHAVRASGVTVTMGTFFRESYIALPITVCTKFSTTTTRLVSAGRNG